jgi:heme-degrading monooxygenase HmoA
LKLFRETAEGETNLLGRRRVMTIRVLIERRIVPENEPVLNSLLMKLRGKALLAKGYISGETLRSLDDPNEYLVISTWNSLEDWKRWEADRERQEIQSRIDSLLRAPSIERIFVYNE